MRFKELSLQLTLLVVFTLLASGDSLSAVASEPPTARPAAAQQPKPKPKLDATMTTEMFQLGYDSDRQKMTENLVRKLKAHNHVYEIKQEKDRTIIIDKTEKRTTNISSKYPGRRFADVDGLLALFRLYPKSAAIALVLAEGYEINRIWSKALEYREKWAALDIEVFHQSLKYQRMTPAQRAAGDTGILPVLCAKRGYYNCMLGKYQEAIVDLTKSIELNPEYLTNYSNRAIAFERLGRQAEAEKDKAKIRELIATKKAKTTLESQPGYSISMISETVEDSMCLELGIAALNQMLKDYPDEAAIYFKRAKYETYLGDYKSVLADLNWILKKSPNIRMVKDEREHVEQLLKNGAPPYGDLSVVDPEIRYEVVGGKLLSVSDLAKMHRGDFRVYLNTLGAYLASENPRSAQAKTETVLAARSEVAKILQVSPLQGRVDLALQYIDCESDDQRIKDCTQYLDAQRGINYEYVARAHAARASSYSRTKDYAKAVDDYTILLLLEPNSPEVYRDRADCYVACKRYKEAILDYTAAIGNDPDKSPSNYLQRAKAYAALGQAELAKKDYQTAETLAKSH